MKLASFYPACAVALLGTGMLGMAACHQRNATAATSARQQTLWLPPDAPTEEPPPAPLSVPLSLPDLAVASPTPDAGAPPDAGQAFAGTTAPPAPPPGPAVAVATGHERSTEVPCGKDAPPNMVCVPGGPFWRGNDTGGKPDEKPRQRITISPFFLDTYEVDNDQYFKCVESGNCLPPIKYYPMFAKAKQPVVAVSWYESYDFCKWAGKRLPTEAEWEKAARGPDGEVYPWGNAPATCDKAVYEEPLGAKGCGTGLTSSVGSRPIGRYGLFDMAGNSWEWVNDWKTDCYAGCKHECGKDCEGPDPKGPCGGGPKHCPGVSQKVLKGGSWYFTADRMRGAERRGVSPSNRGPHRLGFRCARDVTP